MARIQIIPSRTGRARCGRGALVLALLLLLPIGAAAQDEAAPAGEPRYSVGMSSGYGFPLAQDGVDVFASGVPFDVAVGIEPAWRLPLALRLSVPVNILYVEDPVDADPDAEQTPYPAPATIGLGVGVRSELPLGERLSLHADVAGGPFLALSTDSSPEFGGWLGAGAGMSYELWPSLSLEAGATYREYFGLYRDVAAVAGVTYHVPAGAVARPARRSTRPQQAMTRSRRGSR